MWEIFPLLCKKYHKSRKKDDGLGSNKYRWKYRPVYGCIQHGCFTDRICRDGILKPFILPYAGVIGATFLLMDDGTGCYRESLVKDWKCFETNFPLYMFEELYKHIHSYLPKKDG